MNERGASMIQAIAGSLVLAVALLLFGAYLSGMHASQQSSPTAGAQASNEVTHLRVLLNNDNGPAQNALRSGTAQTFAIAGGGSVTVSPTGNLATIAAPDGSAQVFIVAKDASL